MKKISLVINNKKINNIYKAETFFERLKGLMFIEEKDSFILLLTNCNSVHTCFMKFPLTLVCLNEKMEAIRTIKNVKPFKFILPLKKVKHILEIPQNKTNLCLSGFEPESSAPETEALSN